MHYSVPPHAEVKLVRCTKGAIHDVLLDLRGRSATYMKWAAITLTRDNGHAVIIPEGVAHGFQTLEDETDVLYQMSEFFDPACARGVRWNDPSFGIRWPIDLPTLSERDKAFETFTGEIPTRT
jgi:dTDP-4-dehydrorhamnose 3,5-epimerase